MKQHFYQKTITIREIIFHTIHQLTNTPSWLVLDIQFFSSQKPPLKREDSFLQRFTTRQIPETQETVEDTGSEGNTGEHSALRRRRRARRQPRSVVNPDENFYFYWLFVITICVLYNMWTLIVRQSFPELQVNKNIDDIQYSNPTTIFSYHFML